MRAALALGLAFASMVAACGDRDESPWAEEIDVVVASLESAFDSNDAVETARIFSAGGTLDSRHFDEGIATTLDGIVTMVERIWFMNPAASVSADHVFVSADGLIVWWYAHDLDRAQRWAQTLVFGRGNKVASRIFGDFFAPWVYPGVDEEFLLGLLDRYAAAWRGEGSFDEVYADDAIVQDSLREAVWRGRAEIRSQAVEPIVVGPFPHVFVYEFGGTREAIALFQTTDECPATEARRWIFGGDLIVHESRFVHVPSARRCGEQLPDGWWTSFELGGEFRDNVTEIVDVSGATVELIHAEPEHEEFLRWSADRFVAGGLGSPEIDAVWFPPSPDCLDQAGLAIESDERHGGERALVVCFGENRIVSDRSASGWSTPAIAVSLHELAHIWMRERVDDATRDAYSEMIGAEVWRDRSAPRDSGVEHAAYTIAWGLAGTEDARYPLPPIPGCDELTARYELLTGRDPITTCGEGGWSQ